MATDLQHDRQPRIFLRVMHLPQACFPVLPTTYCEEFAIVRFSIATYSKRFKRQTVFSEGYNKVGFQELSSWKLGDSQVINENLFLDEYNQPRSSIGEYVIVLRTKP